MKNTFLKTVLSSTLLLGTSLGCFATPEHRISFGVGTMSYSYIKETIEENADYDLRPINFGDNPVVGQTTVERSWRDLQSKPINFNLHYECTLGEHFGVGLCFGYEHQNMDLEVYKYTFQGRETISFEHEKREYTNDLFTTSIEPGELDLHIFYVMPEATFYYFKKEHVAMYGKLAAGMKFSKLKIENTDEESLIQRLNKKKFSGQVSPVCFEFGNKKIRGFMEYGFGHQGLAQFGVKHTFKKKDAE